eukprot:g8913.t1
MVPEAILQKCIKIADEAPTDLKSNLRRAYAKFSQDGSVIFITWVTVRPARRWTEWAMTGCGLRWVNTWSLTGR